MNWYRLIALTALLCCYDIRATVLPGYPVALISDSVKQNAFAVVREDRMDYFVTGANTATLKVKFVITVLKKQGEGLAAFRWSYDKFRSISDLSGIIYDANGTVIKKIHSRDFKDYSAVSDFSLYEDDRMKVYYPLVPFYPYTVEYECSINYSSLFYVPDWTPFGGYNVGVEQSVFSLHFPLSNMLIYKELNLPVSPVVVKNGKNVDITWEMDQIKPVEEEPYSPSSYTWQPVVLVSSLSFDLGGYPGSLNSWANYGKWVNKLLKDRDQLPVETVNTIRDLVKDAPDDMEKIRRIYHYMQNKTRYVSIQLGIGGYQPFAADIVNKTGYGDCKALSNYMAALLKSVGISSLYTLVRAGDDADDIFTPFCSGGFNHVILCVPSKKDTVWLECTNQRMPFGYLGTFTDDRHVLFVGDSGVIAKTPSYGPSDNVYIYSGSFMIDPDGNGNASLKLKARGIMSNYLFGASYENHEDQIKHIYKLIELPNFEVTSYSIHLTPDRIPQAVLDHEVRLHSYGSLSGKRMFLPLNQVDRYSFVPPRNKNRKLDMQIRRPLVYSDTLRFTIPAGYSVEFLPDSSVITSIFGHYKNDTHLEGNEIVFTRILSVNKGIFPRSEYDEMIRFFREINVADNAKAVLTK